MTENEKMIMKIFSPPPLIHNISSAIKIWLAGDLENDCTFFSMISRTAAGRFSPSLTCILRKLRR